jgi:hypothetical protein
MKEYKAIPSGNLQASNKNNTAPPKRPTNRQMPLDRKQYPLSRQEVQVTREPSPGLRNLISPHSTLPTI